MPPKPATKGSSGYGIKRRSRRIALKVKSIKGRQLVSSKELPSSTKKIRKSPYRKKTAVKSEPASSNGEPLSSTTENGKPSIRKKSVTKRQPVLSNEEQSTSTKGNGKPSHTKKSVTKRQLVSSNEGQSTSTKRSAKPSYSKKPVKKRPRASSNEGQSISAKKTTAKKQRVVKMDEINEAASKIGLDEKEDFSIYIKTILRELSPDLTISVKAIADLNIFLNHVFDLLARKSAMLLIESGKVVMTDKDIETAVAYNVSGQLPKYCIVEGRRAVKKWFENDK